MSLLRSLTVFILSSIFILAIFTAVTAYTLGSLLQKDSVKVFIKSEILNATNEQCQNQCNQSSDCMQSCLSYMSNETQTSVDNAVNAIYQQKFFGVTMDQISALLSQYFLSLAIGIFMGALLLFVSKTPLSTLGKNFLTLAAWLFIIGFIPQFMFASVNLPVDLGGAITNYLSTGLNQQFLYAIVFLVAGVVMIIINYALSKRKPKDKK